MEVALNVILMFFIYRDILCTMHGVDRGTKEKRRDPACEDKSK